MAAAIRPPEPGLTTYKTVNFEVHVSCYDPKNLTFTAWRSTHSLKRLDLAIDKAKKVQGTTSLSQDQPHQDRVRVVRIESTCTVLHEIK